MHADSRGVFFEWFTDTSFSAATGHRFDLHQANCSVSAAGVLRGLHFAQVPPSQAKYVTCLHGSVFDVVVDIRVGSPTFGQWDAVVLDDRDRRSIYLSEGLGHAFLALQDDSTVMYLCSAGYNPGREHTINPLDPAIGIAWPAVDEPGAVRPRRAGAHARQVQAPGLLPTWDGDPGVRRATAGLERRFRLRQCSTLRSLPTAWRCCGSTTSSAATACPLRCATQFPTRSIDGRRDERVRVVVLTGAGSTFCAGFDLKEFSQPELARTIRDSSRRYHLAVWGFAKPMIAAVNGAALGGGFDLALLCDIRIATPDATFAHPEIKFGAPPLFTPLQWIVGAGIARDLCLTGRKIDAAEAHRIGLVNTIADNVLGEAVATAG